MKCRFLCNRNKLVHSKSTMLWFPDCVQEKEIKHRILSEQPCGEKGRGRRRARKLDTWSVLLLLRRTDLWSKPKESERGWEEDGRGRRPRGATSVYSPNQLNFTSLKRSLLDDHVGCQARNKDALGLKLRQNQRTSLRVGLLPPCIVPASHSLQFQRMQALSLTKCGKPEPYPICQSSAALMVVAVWGVGGFWREVRSE